MHMTLPTFAVFRDADGALSVTPIIRRTRRELATVRGTYNTVTGCWATGQQTPSLCFTGTQREAKALVANAINPVPNTKSSQPGQR